jgi:hypothetical protein
MAMVTTPTTTSDVLSNNTTLESGLTVFDWYLVQKNSILTNLAWQE